MTYLQQILDTDTPQSEPLDDRQVANNAGGYTYPVDDGVRMHRFLIMGSEGGSYYQDERKLTIENAQAVKRYVATYGSVAVSRILQIALERRAPRVSPALFCLAIAASATLEDTRKAALDALPYIASTASHLEEFAGYVDSMRGWGRSLRTAIGRWYTDKEPVDVAYQAVKYRTRSGWSHRDLLRKAHPSVEADTDLWHIFQWLTQGTVPPERESLRHIHHYLEAQECELQRLSELITYHGLPREAVPTAMLQKDEVWAALGPQMPAMAFVRNLPALTTHKAIRPMEAQWAVERLERLGPRDGRPAQVHPFHLLTASVVYRSGQSVDGKGKWDPVPQVSEALDAAYDNSFSAAPSTGQRVYLAVDVSGSMSYNTVGKLRGLTAAKCAAAVIMMIARRERNHYIKMFDTNPLDIHIAAHDSLTDVMGKVPIGGATDMAQPFLHAMKENIPVDCFIIATDGETFAGRTHPAKALQYYRAHMGIPAKAVQLAFCSNRVSIMDPADAGTLDIPGFDSGLPAILSDFMA